MTAVREKIDRVLPRIRLEARVIAVVLLADAALHLYWITGARWPAPSTSALSNAVLGFVVPFTPPVLVPLVVILLAGAALVIARTVFGREHRFGWLFQLGVVALTLGLALRGVAGIVWIFTIGMQAGLAFFWLNLLLYTPLCLALAVLAWRLTRQGARRRPRPSVVQDFFHDR